jgi:hypothetical protein
VPPDNSTTDPAGASVLEMTMRVQKGHKIQLLPNNKQRSKFKEWSGAHRWAYNFGLERKKKAYKDLAV